MKTFDYDFTPLVLAVEAHMKSRLESASLDHAYDVYRDAADRINKVDSLAHQVCGRKMHKTTSHILTRELVKVIEKAQEAVQSGYWPHYQIDNLIHHLDRLETARMAYLEARSSW